VLRHQLPAATIVLDPTSVAAYDRAPDTIKAAERKAAAEVWLYCVFRWWWCGLWSLGCQAAEAAKKPKKKRRKMRGRSKPTVIEAKKQASHDAARREKVREQASSQSAGDNDKAGPAAVQPRHALSRFESPKK
jgi:hypothetical protein